MKRKPRGYWKSKANQKHFLDGLLTKYGLQPYELTHALIKAHSGQGAYKQFGNMVDLLNAHYGPISLLDIPRVPPGTWDVKANRVKAVREAVARLNKRPRDIMLADFCRIGLKGAVNATGMTHIPLLREAGFDVPDPVSWQSAEVRARKIRELVDEAGGPMRVTRNYLDRKAPGLVEHYVEKYKKIGRPKHIPLLFRMLNEAGYDVTAEECLRGFEGIQDTFSKHGHLNHSMAEAMLDDEVYELVGDRHMHDVIYPGQKGRGPKMNCDFVLFQPGAAGTDPVDPLQGLWVEYAGIIRPGKPSSVMKRYAKQLERKKALARKAGIKLILIKPEAGDMLGDIRELMS
jgi:hypothetical protein